MIESEKAIDRYLSEELKKLNGWSIKLPALHVRGLPDRLCLLPKGRLFFAELKTTKEKPTTIQMYVHRKLRGLGFEVWVIDKKETVNIILRTYESKEFETNNR